MSTIVWGLLGFGIVIGGYAVIRALVASRSKPKLYALPPIPAPIVKRDPLPRMPSNPIAAAQEAQDLLRGANEAAAQVESVLKESK